MTQDNQRAAFEAQIELPPFPEEKVRSARSFTPQALVVSVESAQNYARAAIEHDRKSRAEPAAVAACHAIEPYLEAIVCYASTVNEYDGNKAAKMVRDVCAGRPAEPLKDAELCPECGRGTHGLSSELKWCGYCGAKLTGTPFRAEPVNGPSDEGLPDYITDALNNLEHDNYERSQCGYRNRQADLNLIRALLARYGNAAQPRSEVEGVTLDGCLETLFRLGQYLGIDYAQARKAPNAPSDVYIKAIEGRVAQHAASAEPIHDHDLSTSKGGRAYLAEFFAKRLHRHDFQRYITETLAADFACVLSKWLSDSATVAAQPSVPDDEAVRAALSEQFRQHPQTKPLIGREALVLRCVRVAMLAAAPTPPADGQDPHV